MTQQMKHEFSKQTNKQIVPPNYAFTLVRENNVLPWLKLLVSLSQWRPGFNSRPADVGFMVDEVAPGQDFLDYFEFPLSVSFQQYALLFHSSITNITKL
jgi:hypothetical protein